MDNNIVKNDGNLFLRKYNLNGDQINLLKIIINFYKENGYPQVDFDNENQMKNLIKSLFSGDIISIEKFDELNYIKSEKKIIRFIYNSNNRFLFQIPTFFTNKELYSIAERYKNFHTTNFILIHNNRILKKEDSSINEMPNNDKIFIIENRLYPDDSYYINLRNKYRENDNINVIASFNGHEKINYNISKEATIQELIRTIVEHRGLALNDCYFLYNSLTLNPTDTRKIKEINNGRYVFQIVCGSNFQIVDNPPLGKIIFAFNKIIGAPITIGALDPIKLLFTKVENQKSISVKKIIIGKVELKPESDNYLSYYGIKENFNFNFE